MTTASRRVFVLQSHLLPYAAGLAKQQKGPLLLSSTHYTQETLSSDTFKALVLDKANNKITSSIKQLKKSDLTNMADGDILIRVCYSSLNFKDALAITGKPGIVKNYPMIPGIDVAGIVEHSICPDYKKGDQVILTGHGLGENRWGGLAEYVKVKSEWIIPLSPSVCSFSLKEAMGIGTAGFTAMQCIYALKRNGSLLPPASTSLPVLVTGAGGGVGSIACVLLASMGYKVVAATGRKGELTSFLKDLGVHDIIDRSILATKPSSPSLNKIQYSNAIDVVGGQILANLITHIQPGGAVAACGVAGGAEVVTTVFPFILRGVSLLGVNSVHCPKQERLEIWKGLDRYLPKDKLETISQVKDLDQVEQVADDILLGKIRGRVLVKI